MKVKATFLEGGKKRGREWGMGGEREKKKKREKREKKGTVHSGGGIGKEKRGEGVDTLGIALYVVLSTIV
jgi:hypothetical protein